MFVWRYCLILSLILLAGCSSFTGKVDQQVDELAAIVDHADIRPASDHTAITEAVLPAPQPTTSAAQSADKQQQDTSAGAQQSEKRPPQRLVVPPGLPGSDAPPITKFPEDPEKKKGYLNELFPPLPAAPQMRPLAPGPEGHPMTLADLQRLAAVYSPAIKSAEAAVEAAKGAVKQAGAYPNPSFFFEQDTVGTGSAGYEGFGVHQTVKTANKLKLQEAAAVMDLLNARLALKRAYSDLAYQVRNNYFAILVALESVKVNKALYGFTNDIYRVQVELVEGTIAAPYEPLQLRPLAIQARFNLVQAQNQYLASWKQLAGTLGLRDMPPTELAGRVDMPVPVFDYNQVLAKVLASHTDVLTANNSIQKARFNLELAKVTPVPDVDLNVLAQKDYTSPPNLIVHSLQFSFPVPVFNRNLGNIKQAEGQLAQAQASPDQARNTLTNSLADAFNRYVTNRENVDIAMQQIRDQIRAYRNLYARRQSDPTAVSFGDLVTAQQTLAGYIAGYITALGLQWTAVNDVANLLQADDLFQAGPTKEMLPVPDMKELVPGCIPLTSTPPPQGGEGKLSMPIAAGTPNLSQGGDGKPSTGLGIRSDLNRSEAKLPAPAGVGTARSQASDAKSPTPSTVTRSSPAQGGKPSETSIRAKDSRPEKDTSRRAGGAAEQETTPPAVPQANNFLGSSNSGLQWRSAGGN
jgi:cobalt-zinc-cadmium efflux system outer membrane protein